jgi:hypothetical protein
MACSVPGRVFVKQTVVFLFYTFIKVPNSNELRVTKRGVKFLSALITRAVLLSRRFCRFSIVFEAWAFGPYARIYDTNDNVVSVVCGGP